MILVSLLLGRMPSDLLSVVPVDILDMQMEFVGKFGPRLVEQRWQSTMSCSWLRNRSRRS